MTLKEILEEKENINDFAAHYIDFDKGAARFAIEDTDASRTTIELNQED